MNCETLIRELGMNCRKVSDVDAYHIVTPLTFSDGAATGFYIQPQGANFLVTDDADLCYQFVKRGAEMSHRWKSIQRKAEFYGLTYENGKIYTHSDSLFDASQRFIKFINYLVEYETEIFTVDETIDDLIEQVITQLIRVYPDKKIERHFKITGQSKREHEFAFLWGDDIGEVVKPNPHSGGSVLRKIIDVAAITDREFYIFIDDREAKEAAVFQELSILGQVSNAMRFSELEHKAPPIRH